MLTLLLKLLACHFIGDFVFQPSRWVYHKTQFKFKSIYLYLHILVHALLLCLFLYNDPLIPSIVIIIPLSHLIIDGLKLHYQYKWGPNFAFVADQIAHLTMILLFVRYHYTFSWNIFSLITTNAHLLLVLSLVLLTYFSSVIIKLLLGKWRLDETVTNEAGKYIGILERLFVFAFIVLDFWPGIGFLIAAKSVFRFSDLNNARDRNLTEYIVIGTFLSFGIAMLIALIYMNCKKIV